MEIVSKLNLSNFFNEWYYVEGYPIYAVKTEITDSTRIFIQQKTTSPNFLLFTTPIELLIASKNLSDILFVY